MINVAVVAPLEVSVEPILQTLEGIYLPQLQVGRSPPRPDDDLDHDEYIEEPSTPALVIRNIIQFDARNYRSVIRQLQRLSPWIDLWIWVADPDQGASRPIEIEVLQVLYRDLLPTQDVVFCLSGCHLVGDYLDPELPVDAHRDYYVHCHDVCQFLSSTYAHPSCHLWVADVRDDQYLTRSMQSLLTARMGHYMFQDLERTLGTQSGQSLVERRRILHLCQEKLINAHQLGFMLHSRDYLELANLLAAVD